jgi:hypothetical protein
MLPLNGWLVDRIGAKSLYLWCFTAFTISSALCGLAWSADSLIGFRVLQGMSGGLLAPMAQMMMARAAGKHMARIMGYASLPIMLGPILDPVLAGAILQHASWHWLFFINVPIGAIAIFLAWTYLPNDHEETRRDGVALIFLVSLCSLRGWRDAVRFGSCRGAVGNRKPDFVAFLTAVLHPHRNAQRIGGVGRPSALSEQDFLGIHNHSIPSQWRDVCRADAGAVLPHPCVPVVSERDGLDAGTTWPRDALLIPLDGPVDGTVRHSHGIGGRSLLGTGWHATLRVHGALWDGSCVTRGLAVHPGCWPRGNRYPVDDRRLLFGEEAGPADGDDFAEYPSAVGRARPHDCLRHLSRIEVGHDLNRHRE